MKKNKELATYVLGGLIVLGFFVLLYLLVYRGLPPENDGILKIVVGSLITAFSMVVSYFYGSSLGSKQKTELLEERKKDEKKPL